MYRQVKTSYGLLVERTFAIMIVMLASAAAVQSQSNDCRITFANSDIEISGVRDMVEIGAPVKAERLNLANRFEWAAQSLVNPRSAANREIFYVYDLTALEDLSNFQSFVGTVDDTNPIKLAATSDWAIDQGSLDMLPLAATQSTGEFIAAALGEGKSWQIDGSDLSNALSAISTKQYDCIGNTTVTAMAGDPGFNPADFSKFGKYVAVNRRVPSLSTALRDTYISYGLEGIVESDHGGEVVQWDWPTSPD